MSTAATPSTTGDGHGGDAHGNGHAHHNPHLAHHFDTPEQQMASGKLGIWLFLATEILMFGGLFCAYSVYRHNHPEVFSFAHHALNKWLGGINTVVLIASSLTMAWGVRASQLGKNNQLVVCLACTILGGYIFMGIKAVEYRDKWEHHLWLGSGNEYRQPITGGALPAMETKGEGQEKAGMPAAPAMAAPHGEHAAPAPSSAPGHDAKVETSAHSPKPETGARQELVAAVDANAGTPDAASIRPPTYVPGGPVKIAEEAKQAEAHGGAHGAGAEHGLSKEQFNALPGRLDRQRVYTFFQTYFVMTGLHGIHVLVGMGLIFWILLRAVGRPARSWLLPLGLMSTALFFFYLRLILPGSSAAHPDADKILENVTTIGWVILGITGAWFLLGVVRARSAKRVAPEFGPEYFAPVDIVGLYWHIVDLIWIFLFPLLYLIH